jgi:pimeloyl-ACP methyl ester carboxylesterase
MTQTEVLPTPIPSTLAELPAGVALSPELGDLIVQFWQWRGHQIRYIATGTGQPLVLVHGFGAAIGHWRKNIPVLAAAGYRVYALDLLGFGGSEKPLLDYRVELWQDLLHDFCQAHIQAPVIWIGNSIGGLISLSMAADYPQLTHGVVLLNCAGSLNHRPEDLNLPLRIMMKGFNGLVSSAQVGPWVFNLVRKRQQIRRSLQQVYCDSTAITDELVELIYQPACDANAQKVFATILTAPPGPRPSDLLPRVQAPLLVLWGEADPWTPVSAGKLFQDWAGEIPIQFQTIPNTGHCPHDERPDVVNPLITNWLATLAG